jgi:hypothetical protein
LLYGLLAAPLHDPRLLERAARVLGSHPGGPGASEARQRLASGAPLALGLSRAASEELRDELAGLGLAARIGPAPEGTPPLSAARPPRPRRVVLPALLGAALGAAALLWLRASGERATPPLPPAHAEPGPQPQATGSDPGGAASPEALPAEGQLELWAQLRPAGASLQRVGWVRGRGGEPPAGPVTLVGSAAGFEIVSESFEESAGHTQRRAGAAGRPPMVIRTVPFRLALARAALRDAEELVLEARWGEWRSQSLALAIPRPRSSDARLHADAKAD